MAYYGKYRAIVVDINDPEKRGRIKVICPEVLGQQISNWALPCLPPSTFIVPDKGSLVWVEFEGGKKDSPIWTGLFYTREQVLSKFNISDYKPEEYYIDTKELIKIVSHKNGFTLRTYKGDADINTTEDTGITIVGELNSADINVEGDIYTTGDITSDGQIKDSDGYVHSHY